MGRTELSRLSASRAEHPFPKGVTDSGPVRYTPTAPQSIVSGTRVLVA